MFKKYMAMFMACVLTLALSVPIVAYASSYEGERASADEITSSANKGSDTITMKYTSVTQIPVLQIKISNRAGLILNPYKLKYEKDGRMDFDASTDFMLDGTSSGNANTDSNAGTTYRQIISSPMVIESTTEVPVLVGASVSTTVSAENGTAVYLKATPIAKTAVGKTPADTAKIIYMWLAADASVAADASGAVDADVAVINRALALNPTDNAAKTLVLSATGGKVPAVSNPSFVTIPAAAEDETQYAAFVFNGEMVVEPKTGTTNTPWTANDKVTPTVTLSLSILENDWASELSADNG